MENNRCRRWITTNQDEFQHPANKKVEAYITSEEFGRYEDCIIRKDCAEEAIKQDARETICCAEQNLRREPVSFPTDSHIDAELRATKPPWCRCLATGDPNFYEENREEAKTDDMCYCRMCYNQEDTPQSDNPRTKIYSSTHFIDFRDPKFPFIENQIAIQKALDDRFLAYKAKADAADARKERKLAPLPRPVPGGVEPNCIGNYGCLPPGKMKKPWEADQSWFREESPACVKNMMKKWRWTTCYREMNKDGAPLPIEVRVTPTSCVENPPGDPVRLKQNTSDLSDCTVVNPSDVFEKWDRPQVRYMARRCDTISNNPYLDKCCTDKDPYFQEQYLDRTKFAVCPSKQYEVPSEENFRLVRENKLRQPYDKMIPHWAGYDPIQAPPVCKIKKIFNIYDPYDPLSVYNVDFNMHPKDNYEHPVESYKPTLEKKGVSLNPINALSKKPLPDADRLSCYMECKVVPCQSDPEGQMSSFIECQKFPCKRPERRFGIPGPPEQTDSHKPITVVIPAVLQPQVGMESCIDMDIPKNYQECVEKPKEDLLQIGTYVRNTDPYKHQKGMNFLSLGKKKEFKHCQ